MVCLKDKTLLIITPSYPNEDESFIRETFVKHQVAELKRYFKKIIIIAPVFRSFGYLKKDQLCKDYTYENVDVFFPRSFYIPIFWLSKILIDTRLKVVKKTIENNDIHFDLIHAHFTWPSGYIGVKLKDKYRKPVIITIHENSDWFDREIKMNHPLLKKTWSNADALIRVNRTDVPILQKYNERVFAIPNGFSPDFHPIDIVVARNWLDIPTKINVIFALGNLTKRKGFNYLIDAMADICSRREDVICYIGGTGQEKINLQKQIDHMHLNEKVKLLGSIPGDTLTYWMNACDVFVLPSLSESFGVVQIEAFACGKPVISARNRGSEEVIISDEIGLLTWPADSADLAEKLQVALDRKWDSKAILKYAQGFSWEIIAKEILDLYEDVLG